MIPELSKVCRTCLAPDKDLISIYDQKESNNDGLTNFVDIIGNLTNIMPNKFDGLPELVCLPCSGEIKKIHSFKMKCINSECILRKMLEQTDEKNIILKNETIITIDKLPDHQIPCDPSDLLIIKSEEPSCSVYDRHTDNEEKERSIMVDQVDHKSTETHITHPIETIIKEEPSLSAWSAQDYESDMEGALTEANEENQLSNLEPNFCENSQNHVSEVEPELRDGLQESDKKNKSKLKCPKCHKLFMHLARLQRHIKSNTCVGFNPKNGQLVFACSICGKKYNQKFSLQRHSLISHKQKLTRKIITDSTELHLGVEIENTKDVENQLIIEATQPINNELNRIEAMRQCNCCKEVFENDDDLARHKAVARHKKPHPEKSQICNICNKAFSFSHNLKMHLMKHKEIKPFKCEQCNQGFVRNSCLTRHLKTHSGDRPFTCEFCSKGFPYMYALKTHQRSHTEERPYSCTICSMRFKFPNTLKEHHRTHTGEKPYACKLCPRRLSSKTNFRIHMRCHEKKLGISVQKLITDSEKVPV